MRVTQSMLSNNLLRNLNTSYSNMGKLQQQLQSGTVLSRPSDDPVVAVRGMGYRVDLDKIEQYQRNMKDANTWLDTTDQSLSHVNDALTRVKELIVQAANDTNTIDERQAIATEISQLKEQIRDMANTQVGDSYIFSGTQTDKPLYVTGELEQNPNLTEDGKNGVYKINTFNGVSLQINTNAADLFASIDTYMGELTNLLNSGATGEEIGKALGDELMTANGPITGLTKLSGEVLTVQAQIGAKQNRVELMQNRLDIQEINVTKQLSENEDTDYSKAITDLATAESIHQSALSVGAKIIQQTLVDFIR